MYKCRIENVYISQLPKLFNIKFYIKTLNILFIKVIVFFLYNKV